MAGIAIVLDLLRKSPSLTTQSLHASGYFSAKAAASAAAASVVAGTPYVYKSLFSLITTLPQVKKDRTLKLMSYQKYLQDSSKIYAQQSYNLFTASNGFNVASNDDMDDLDAATSDSSEPDLLWQFNQAKLICTFKQNLVMFMYREMQQ